MLNMGFQALKYLQISIFIVYLSGFLTGINSDEQSKATEKLRDTAKDATEMLTNSELGEKIKDLLTKRPERPDRPDFDDAFKNLFGELDTLASKMHDDFEFDVKLYGPPDDHPVQSNKNVMRCLNNGTQVKHLLKKVHEIIKDLREDYLEDHSKEIDDSRDNDTTINPDIDDSKNNSTDDSRDNDTTTDNPDDSRDNDTTTDSPDDSRDNDTTTDSPDSKQDSRDDSTNSTEILDTKRVQVITTELLGYDLDELLRRLEDDDVDCLTGFFSNSDKKFLCHRFAQRSPDIFGKIMASGADCDDYLKNSDDDDDNLDVFQQLVIYKQFKDKDSHELTDDDVKKVLMLAPEVIDDDFLEDITEELFKKNLQVLAKLAGEQTGNPKLRYALRERLGDVGKLSTDDIQKIGPGLFSVLNLEQIKSLNWTSFLYSNITLEEDDSREQDSKPDDHGSDNEDDDIKTAVGLHIKDAIKNFVLPKQQIGRALRFLHHDLEFIHRLDPDDLVDVLDDIKDIKYDYDDARSVLDRLILSSRFPSIKALNGQNLIQMGKLLVGMNIEFLSQLNKEAIKEVVENINDIDFDDYQANQLLQNMEHSSTLEIYKNINAEEIRKLGRLFRGMPTNIVILMKEDAIEEVLDKLNDLDLNDAMKKIIIDKVRHDDKISHEFLKLDDFAEVVSLDDLDDFDDDDIKMYINVSSNVNWRLPQAAVLVHKYKIAHGSQRLRPADLAEMKLITPGFLPDDLGDMIVSKDDFFDAVDELKDIHESLTSGQIDELVEKLSDLINKHLIIDELQAIQATHILAYLTPELFEKLEFTKAGKIAFISQVAKMSTHKMSRAHVEFLAETILEMLDDSDSAESKLTPADRESWRLRSLGQMALGLKPSQIQSFSGMAIIDNMDILKTLALSKAQAKAILEKVKDTVENWKCNIEILLRVGALLQHLDDPFDDDCDSNFHENLPSILPAITKSLEQTREMFQKRLDEGFAKEDDDAIDDVGEKRLINAMIQMTTKKLNVRRRRSPTSSGILTCDTVIQVKNSITSVDIQLFKSMSNEEVKKCLPRLGSVRGLPREVHKELLNKITSIYPDFSSWSPNMISATGSIIAGMSPAQIGQLNGLNGVDVLQSIGKHGEFSNEQLKAGFQRWMQLAKKNDTSNITGGEFSSLSDFVCGLEPLEINKLKDTTFKSSLETIGHSSKCTSEQYEAYLKKAITAYGSQINVWSPAVVAEMGFLLGTLNDDQIKMLTAKQLALLPPKTIQTLPTEKMIALTSSQLMALSTNQANAITPEQYKGMTPEQQKIVASKASISFTPEKDKPMPGGKDTGKRNDSSKTVQLEYWILLTAMIACVFM